MSKTPKKTPENPNYLSEVEILLVEDDEGHAELIERNLRNTGIDNKISHFDDGDKIVQFLQTLAIGNNTAKYLMILDLNMPRLNGMEVLQYMKSDETTKNIPIVILTTANDDISADSCYEYGCNLFMHKPVNYEEFCSAIQDLGAIVRSARFRGHIKANRTMTYY